MYTFLYKNQYEANLLSNQWIRNRNQKNKPLTYINLILRVGLAGKQRNNYFCFCTRFSGFEHFFCSVEDKWYLVGTGRTCRMQRCYSQLLYSTISGPSQKNVCTKHWKKIYVKYWISAEVSCRSVLEKSVPWGLGVQHIFFFCPRDI